MAIEDDDDDDDYTIKQRLGYKPNAPPPDLSKVQTTINNRQNTAVRKRMEENKNRKPVKIGNGINNKPRKTTEDEYWPSTPPEVRKQLQDQIEEKERQKQRNREIFDDPKRYDQTVSDSELGIRESHSAPLDEIASRNNTVTQRESRDLLQKASHRAVSAPPFDPDREDSAKFQPFRNRNFKKKVVIKRDESDSDDSDVEYIVRHKVKRGVKVAERPLSLYSMTSTNERFAKKEELLHQKMILEAEMALREDNLRAAAKSKAREEERRRVEERRREIEKEEEDMRNTCCLFPCCCCFCRCAFKQKHKKKNRRH